MRVTAPRVGGHRRVLALLMFWAVVASACAVDVQQADNLSPTLPTPGAATPAGPSSDDAPPSSDVDAAEQGGLATIELALQELQDAFGDTAMQDALRFRHVATVTIDDEVTASVRQGVYFAGEGVGYGELKPAEPMVADADLRLDPQVGAERDESFGILLRNDDERYRVLDGNFWLYSRVGESGLPAWAVASSEIGGEGQLAALQAAAVDPRFYLNEIGRALVDTIEVTTNAEGATTAMVLFDAAIVGPLSLQPLEFAQMVDFDRFSTNDVLLPGTVELDPHGLVRFVSVDLDLWWQAFFAEVGMGTEFQEEIGAAELRSTSTLAIAEVQGTTVVEAPCRAEDIVPGKGALAGLDSCRCPISSTSDVDPDQVGANLRQILTVVNEIPAGTTVDEILAAPTYYLSARAVPEELLCAESIESPAALQELAGGLIAGDVPVGSFLDQRHVAEPPPLPVLAQVLVATRTIPSGTTVRSLVEDPAMYLWASSIPQDRLLDGAIQSVSDLSLLGDAVFGRDVLAGEQLVASAIDQAG